MSFSWVVIETLAVLVECAAFVYFLHSRYRSKIDSAWPLLVAWLIVTAWGLTATFLDFPVILYDSVSYSFLLVYLLLAKQGRVLHKFFGVAFTYGLSIALSMVGAGLAGFMTDTTYQHSLETQDISRFLAIVFIKMLQVAVFYALAKKQSLSHNFKKRSFRILFGTAIIDFVCVLLLWFFVQALTLSEQHLQILTWIAAGFLLQLVALFVMYEMFAHEEKINLSLSSSLQRFETESHYYREIDALYDDLRIWRHEYKNNLVALRTLVLQGQNEEAAQYIDKISGEPSRNRVVLQTENRVLDAVVSTKLMQAQSQGIGVNIQVAYPGGNQIEDSDLCAIVGNLLDNAIEACGRMADDDGERFIGFELLVIGKSLTVKIRNSFNGVVCQDGERYRSMKQERGHGIGLHYVDSIVSKYQGYIEKEHSKGVFEVRVMLPLIPPNGAK